MHPLTGRALPAEVEAVFRDFRSAEFATLARDGVPVAVQLSPMWQPEQGRFLVTTGIGLPHKAYHARRYPRVALLFSNPTGSGQVDPPAVLVQGDATVSDLTTWDDDLAAFWPWIFARQPTNTSLAMAPFYRYVIPWYYQRVKIHVVPRRIRWWPGRDMSVDPCEVDLAAPGEAAAPPRGPAPETVAPPPGSGALEQTLRALARFPTPRLTVLEPSGYPASSLCRAEPDAAKDALRLDVPDWLAASSGPASLMSHRHDEQLWNLAGFLTRGLLEADAGGWLFRPTGYASLGGGSPAQMLGFLRGTRRAARAYLGRRGTPPPPIPWEKIAAAKKAARAVRP